MNKSTIASRKRRAKLKEQGLKEVRGVWATEANEVKIKEYAKTLESIK